MGTGWARIGHKANPSQSRDYFLYSAFVPLIFKHPTKGILILGTDTDMTTLL